MKKLFTFILLLVSMASFAATNFWDLAKSTQRQSQWVQQFDAKTKQGGGYFKYYGTSNTGIQNIAGYQIKVANSSTGYYRRVDPVNQFNVVWCGAQNVASPLTLQAQGWTQALADSMWGSGLTDVTVDTYDRAAIAYAYKLMETKGFQMINFEPRDYYVNPRDIYLPDYFATSPFEKNIFLINFNGARQWSTGSGAFAFMKSNPSTQTEGLVYYMRRKFIIQNGYFMGSSNQTGIEIGATYNLELRGNYFLSLSHGIIVRFGLNPTIEGNEFLDCTYNIELDNGNWTGTTATNAQSNVAYIIKNRIYAKDTDGATVSCVSIRGASGLYGLHNVLEGGNPQYNLYFNNLATTTVKDGYWGHNHHENIPTVANMYIRSAGQFHIENTGQLGAGPYITFDNAAGYPYLILSNIPNLPTGTKFRCTDGGVTWVFHQMRDAIPANDIWWDLTGGGIKPNVGPTSQRQYDVYYGAIR